MPTIGILGATGHIGREILNDLTKNHGVDSKDIIAFGRQVEKLSDFKEGGGDVRAIDYSNVETMTEAFKGVDVLCFVPSPNFDMDARAQEHENILQAAKAGGVSSVVFISFIQAHNPQGHPLAESYAKSEKAVIGSGIPYTICRNTFYGDLSLNEVSQAIKSGSHTTVRGGDKGTSIAMRSDLARAISAVLIKQDEHVSKIYNLTGPELVTPKMIADVASEVSGKEIQHKQVSPEENKNLMVSNGMDEGTASFITSLDPMYAAMDEVYSDFERLTGFPARRFSEVAREFFKDFERM